jgi:hypothetical protein
MASKTKKKKDAALLAAFWDFRKMMLSNVYVISRSSRREIYRQRGNPDITQFRSHHFSRLSDTNDNKTLPNIAYACNKAIIYLDWTVKHATVKEYNASNVYAYFT